PFAWQRSVSIASTPVYLMGDSYLWVSYYSLVTDIGSGESSGSISAPNCIHLLMNYSGLVAGRVWRGQNQGQGGTAQRVMTMTVGPSGAVTSLPVLSQSDLLNLQDQLATAAIGAVRFTAADRMRSSPALRDLFIAGGCPATFDGESPAEQGFH